MSGQDRQSSKAAERYAIALFDLAAEAGAIEAIEGDLNSFLAMAEESENLRRLIDSPLYAAEDKARALSALAGKSGAHALTAKFFGAAALGGRASALPAMARAYRVKAAAWRGVIEADVASAIPLSEKQLNELETALKKALGRKVDVRSEIQPELLGGLTVRVGSQLYDSSLKTKLEGLKTAMKEG